MKTVLIADDSIFMQKWLENIIAKQKKYKVITFANNGQEAIEQYKKEKTDIVILDIIMPKIDGLTALREIISYDKKAKVIVCSSLGTKENLKKAIKIGAKDFVVKPYFHNLIEALDKIEQSE